MGCSDDTNSINPDCSDPAYRAAHPDECKGFTLLILEPEYALTEPEKTVTYKVILRANGTEMEITKGLTFASSNVGAAIVGPDGIATGVSAGSTTISVAWQDLHAYAQIDVVGSCADTNQNFAILIDNSRSMGQSFSSSFATKLSFSKSIAADFCDSINFSKDKVSAWKFGDTAAQLYDGPAFGVDANAARVAINSIAGTTQKTNLSAALQDVIDSFPSGGVRVLIVFTDGEYTGDDPMPVAQAFKDSGGFLVVVATRAWGDSFVSLMEMASGGFLLSAYGATEGDILESLSGLKSFICSGSCNPEPGTAPHAKLNYLGWANWDCVVPADVEVIDDDVSLLDDGLIDLIGLGLFDLLPGNGLYLDMRGTGELAGYPDHDFPSAQMRSKDEFTFTAGQNYKFTIHVAGHNVHSQGVPTTMKIRVRCGTELDEIITITNQYQPLLPYAFTWTPASTHSGKIVFEQWQVSPKSNVGSLVDDITLENLTTVTVLLHDDFDGENEQTVDPSPSYYGGCITLEAQTADPQPPIQLTE